MTGILLTLLSMGGCGEEVSTWKVGGYKVVRRGCVVLATECQVVGK